MKIKIVSTHHTVCCDDSKEITYDVYHGFNRIPLLPFSTEWTLLKSGLTEDELMQYMRPMLIVESLNIITEHSTLFDNTQEK